MVDESAWLLCPGRRRRHRRAGAGEPGGARAAPALRHRPAGFEGSGGQLRAVVTSEGEIEADLCVVATHKEPETTLGPLPSASSSARPAASWSTSACAPRLEGVFAAGDCVEVPAGPDRRRRPGPDRLPRHAAGPGGRGQRGGRRPRLRPGLHPVGHGRRPGADRRGQLRRAPRHARSASPTSSGGPTASAGPATTPACSRCGSSSWPSRAPAADRRPVRGRRGHQGARRLPRLRAARGATLEDIAWMENVYSPPIGALYEPHVGRRPERHGPALWPTPEIPEAVREYFGHDKVALFGARRPARRAARRRPARPPAAGRDRARRRAQQGGHPRAAPRRHPGGLPPRPGLLPGHARRQRAGPDGGTPSAAFGPRRRAPAPHAEAGWFWRSVFAPVYRASPGGSSAGWWARPRA